MRFTVFDAVLSEVDAGQFCHKRKETGHKAVNGHGRSHKESLCSPRRASAASKAAVCEVCCVVWCGVVRSGVNV